jgi:hypothetical protein
MDHVVHRDHAKQIVQNAVAATESRWREYAEYPWKDLDVQFIERGYEQQGFHCFRFVRLLEDRGIHSIDAVGSILKDDDSKYEPDFANGMGSPFYRKLQDGAFGDNGKFFAEAAREFKSQRPGDLGRFYWKYLWYMLRACAFLRRLHGASFRAYVLNSYGTFSSHPNLSEDEFLRISASEWQAFLRKAKPWKPLMGIGENVFDYLIRDVNDVEFLGGEYKFDSANQHFLKVTGIASLIVPFEREAAIAFMRSLELPYTLREINTGIYTYCSKTEGKNYGFCRKLRDCERCEVHGICDKRFDA